MEPGISSCTFDVQVSEKKGVCVEYWGKAACSNKSSICHGSNGKTPLKKHSFFHNERDQVGKGDLEKMVVKVVLQRPNSAPVDFKGSRTSIVGTESEKKEKGSVQVKVENSLIFGGAATSWTRGRCDIGNDAVYDTLKNSIVPGLSKEPNCPTLSVRSKVERPGRDSSQKRGRRVN